MKFGRTLLGLSLTLWVRGAVSAAQPLEIVSPELRGAIQPQVAVSPGGIVYVAFGKGTNISCVVSTNHGDRFGPPTLVGRLPKLALGMRRGPRVVADDHGAVIAAISHADGNVYAWRSTNHGAAWSEPARINDTEGSAREGLHALAGAGAGTVHAAWLDLRRSQTELWASTSRDGGRTWSANVLVYKSPAGHICECCHPSLAADARGHVWAMWRNWVDGARDMYMAVSHDGAQHFSPAVKLGESTWNLKACPMDGGHLAFDEAGRPLAVWRRDQTVCAGSDTGKEKVLSVPGTQPVVARGKRGIYFFWQRGRDLMFKPGSAAADTLVFAASGAFPSVASAATDAPIPIIAWESSTNGLKTILCQRLE